MLGRRGLPLAADDGNIYQDQAERERALRYSRTHEWLVLIGMIWSALSSVLALTTGLSAWLRSRAERLAPRRLGPFMPYAAAVTVLSSLASLPLSYYSGYVVEHRYGLSNQTLKAWLVEQLKGLGLGIALTAPLMQGAYWVIRRWPRRWWAILSALTVPISVVFAALAPVLLMPLFNKFQPLRDRALAKRVTDLAARQGVHVSEVLEMDMSKQTKKANAMFTGLGGTKRIVLGDTMLDEFTADEIEVVLAHELGHQVHQDIWKLVALSAPTSVIALLAAHGLAPVLIRRFGKRWGLDVARGVEDVAALPLLSLAASAAMLGVTPLLNAISRRFVEHRADEYALALTGNRSAFISAMEKLGRMNLANPTPSALVKLMLYTHPPLGERIAYARRFRERQRDDQG